jgi:hypothetical protein
VFETCLECAILSCERRPRARRNGVHDSVDGGTLYDMHATITMNHVKVNLMITHRLVARDIWISCKEYKYAHPRMAFVQELLRQTSFIDSDQSQRDGGREGRMAGLEARPFSPTCARGFFPLQLFFSPRAHRKNLKLKSEFEFHELWTLSAHHSRMKLNGWQIQLYRYTTIIAGCFLPGSVR